MGLIFAHLYITPIKLIKIEITGEMYVIIVPTFPMETRKTVTRTDPGMFVTRMTTTTVFLIILIIAYIMLTPDRKTGTKTVSVMFATMISTKTGMNGLTIWITARLRPI